ncbi:arginase [Halteromyces radiatus]|uniref:arginase n=1 Tax=Halteromyces radiatus TaxID=101107 RepID=UPI00221FEE15|nr:arginase [Halteromyces radiatus]KAI8092471.1 arginase [Halteromyces radiatus]
MVQQSIITTKDISVIACPLQAGQSLEGVQGGPRKIIELGLLTQIETMGWKANYENNDDITSLCPKEDPVVMNLKNPKYVSAATHRLSQQIYERARLHDQFILTLGGDHSIALGSVSGIFQAYPDACLIWVDAHADINTPETTDSGNIHGCPLSFLTGIATNHPDFQWVKSLVKPERLTYIGLRDVDDGEKKILQDFGIKAFSMHHVDKYGIGKVMEMALDAVNPNRDRPIHLSFDVDALDPSVAPSTGTPVRGGLSFREGHYICEHLYETGLLVATDIVEVNPALEDEESAFRTVEVACSLARCCLGETLL